MSRIYYGNGNGYGYGDGYGYGYGDGDGYGYGSGFGSGSGSGSGSGYPEQDIGGAAMALASCAALEGLEEASLSDVSALAVG